MPGNDLVNKNVLRRWRKSDKDGEEDKMLGPHNGARNRKRPVPDGRIYVYIFITCIQCQFVGHPARQVIQGLFYIFGCGSNNAPNVTVWNVGCWSLLDLHMKSIRLGSGSVSYDVALGTCFNCDTVIILRHVQSLTLHGWKSRRLLTCENRFSRQPCIKWQVSRDV